MEPLFESLIEIVRRTSAEIPDDVQRGILAALENEKKDTIAENAMKIIERNIALAKEKSQPLCQDTGSVLFYVDCPVGFDQVTFEETARAAVTEATKRGYLRQNSVDSLTGKNDGTNVGPGAPAFHFHQHRGDQLEVRLMLKGGGCENVGAQYSLPNTPLKANRDLDGCRRVILDAVQQAQGKGCGPGILGICIGAIERPVMNARKRSSSVCWMIAMTMRIWMRWSRIFSARPTSWALARWALGGTRLCWA